MVYTDHMNIMRVLFGLLLIVAMNVTANQSLCAYASGSTRMACCCEATDTDTDECAVSEGSCCSINQPQDAVVPNCTFLSVSPVPSGATPVSITSWNLLAGFDAVNDGVGSLVKPTHLASNKLYLRKRSLLI